jgi:Terpene synthase, N-terminal domain
MKKADELRETIRAMINAATDATQIMNLIDSIQRLGIDYHFQSEIDDKLQCLQEIKFESNDLHQVALRFRLLRQHGCYVSPGTYIVYMTYLINK